MPRRIVIHAGFHKTGTTSVQKSLRANRAALKPYLRSVLRPGLVPIVTAARGFSTWRDPLSLEKFAHRFHAFLSSLGPMPRRTLVLSAEELSGHLPGRGPLADYAAAPVLATEMATIAADLFPRAEIAFHFSTRAPDAWLRSAYWEHVKASSMTLDFEDFLASYSGAADLDAIIDRVAEAQPAPVHRARLEAVADLPGGPVAPVLRAAGVPEDVIAALPCEPPANTQRDPSVLLELLAANRAYPDDRAGRDAAKLAILNTAQETDG